MCLATKESRARRAVLALAMSCTAAEEECRRERVHVTEDTRERKNSMGGFNCIFPFSFFQDFSEK